MKPYFDTNSAGSLLLLVLLAWLSMEAVQFVRQWQWRANPLAELIIGGALASTVISDEAREDRGLSVGGTSARWLERRVTFTNPFTTTCKRPRPCWDRASDLHLRSGGRI
jgi:hypothetical protein